MNQIRWTSLILIVTVLALVIQLLIINPVIAQIPNTTLAQDRNNTKLIVNLKNHTITLVDTRTNETIGVTNMTFKEAANATTDENIITNAENATTNGNLTPEMETVNETLTTNEAGNATTNINLTDKFDTLQGK